MNENKKNIILIIIIIFLLVSSVFISGCLLRRRDDPDTEIRSILFDGYNRTYRVNIPDSYNPYASNAIVFVLHGGGGSAENMENDLTKKGFNKLAEENNFIVIYPEGVENHWNDGRKNLTDNATQLHINDVGFLSLLIDELSDEFNIENNNIFFTGISNGGFMCYRLGFEIPDSIRAIAPVTATISVDLFNNYTPNGTISLCIMCGTEDPLVPYDGGNVSLFNQTRGRILSVNDTVDFWIENNRCNSTPEFYEFPDVDPDDGTRVILEKYEKGIDNTRVYLYSIIGGGHTWPGGLQYFPEWLIGKTCRDIDANEVIWEFFSDLKEEKSFN